MFLRKSVARVSDNWQNWHVTFYSMLRTWIVRQFPEDWRPQQREGHSMSTLDYHTLVSGHRRYFQSGATRLVEWERTLRFVSQHENRLERPLSAVRPSQSFAVHRASVVIGQRETRIEATHE
jgi:hypothetical protein